MAEERLEEIRRERLAKRASQLIQGSNPYPAEAKRSHEIAEVNAALSALIDDQSPITVVGRILALRRHGGVVFLDVRDGTGEIQLQVMRDDIPAEIFARHEVLDVGDFIQAAGKMGQTKRGVPALLVAELHLLAKSIHPLPSLWHGLKDHEARWRQREIDLLLNDEGRRVLRVRSRVINWLRNYLTNQGYVEVETPILQPIPGGAAARPFATHHQALDIPLYLRISSELYLKRLLVAGFEKVFEIDRRFRNEGVDRQHNPEFTMVESQWAYADYEDLMNFTETTLEQLVREVVGTTDVPWQGITLSFAAPFARLRYVDIMNEAFGFDILEETDPQMYLDVFRRHNLEPPTIATYYHFVDEYYKEKIRPTLQQPTLLYDYPAVMVPLAKTSTIDARVAEKFQFVAAGMELNNCYTELNDPVLQREKLVQQQQQHDEGDFEAQRIDEPYLRAMEYGMPPNAGWSLGIDRLVMIITNSPSIRETIAFPLLRPEEKRN